MIPALLLLACGGDGGAELVESSLVQSEVIATVATVRWSTDVDTTGYVRFRTADGVFKTATTALGTEHEVVLVGVPAETQVEWQIIVQEDGVDSLEGALSTWTTGALPTGLPGMAVTGGGQEGFLVLPVLGSYTGPVIVDAEGRIVWYHSDDRGLDVYRAMVAPDGSGIIYNAGSVSGDPAADSMLVKVSWDGTQEMELPVPLLAHDFVELPDGSIGAVAVQYGEGDQADLRGDKLVEIAPDGTITDVWTSWDYYDPETQPGDDPELGWTWVNALDYDAATDSYLVGIRNYSTIVQVPRDSFECGWAIGDEGATISVQGGRFLRQHQFELVDDRLLVFDNEGAGGTKSRAIEYEVDWQAQVATKVWEYQATPSIYSFVLGDVHRYEDGDTLVVWSIAGQIDRVSPDGQPEWQLNTDLGYAFGFVSIYDSLYE